jgi:hypothetical protein
VSHCLSLARVLALVGGLGLVAAFFMPWFASQGLLLSGQFLHNFLATAAPANLRQFLPNSSPSEVRALQVLVDLFAVCGGIGALSSLVGGLNPRTVPVANTLLGLAGGVALLAWALGITRLPPGATPEIGLWLIPASSLAIVLGLAFELRRA